MNSLHLLVIGAALAAVRMEVNAALAVSSDFESGSAKVLELNRETQEIRISPAGDLQRGMPNWWHLRIDGVDTNRPLVLEVVAHDISLPAEGDSEGVTRPLNPAWTLPNCAAVSQDGLNWEQTRPGQRSGSRAVYRLNPISPVVWLAWGPPFTPSDAETFVQRMASTHSFAKASVLARSREGRAVPDLRISEGAKPAAQRPAIVVIGRQHAWEVGGSWVAVGLTEWATSADPRAKWLRENAELIVVPLMDVDHVATGDGGKHAKPQDHNRDWSETPHWPEVAAVQKRLLALAREGRLAVFLDLHNPSSGARLQTFYVQYPPYVGDAMAAVTERFLGSARAAFGEIKLNDGKPSLPEHLPIWKRISAPWVCEHGNSNTVSLTVETPWNIPQGTPAGYRDVGRKLGLTIEEHLRNGQ